MVDGPWSTGPYVHRPSSIGPSFVEKAPVTVHTDYLWFNTKKRQEFVRITDEIAAAASKSGVREGTVLVSAMHITSGVFVNDWESVLIDDFPAWREKLALAGLDY